MAIPNRPIGKPKPKTDPWGWMRAILFPKKGKPAATSTIHEPVRAAPRPELEPILLPGVLPEKDRPAGGERGWRMLWTVGSLLSIMLNVVLLVLLFTAGRELFVLKQMVGGDVLGGLYYNFVKMDQAHIKTDIAVSQLVPVSFDLPISQDTNVTLTADTPINGARVSLTTGGLVIVNAPANIVLPAGTRLPVHLEMVVPVQTSIPISLTVPVDIPMQQTELHEPFVGLQGVVAPFYWMLKPEWRTWQDVPACKPLWLLCALIFK